jgi:hypothetical protein
MPIKVTELQAGDRVVLNCPKSRVTVKRNAEFEACYRTVDEMVEKHDATLITKATVEFLKSGGLWASFLFSSNDAIDLRCGFRVEPDGTMRDDEGRLVYVERRLGRVQAG